MPKTDRLESLVQRELSDILRTEVKDNLGFITVTGVKITNELSYMFVYYSVLGSPDDLEKTQAALERAKGFIKNQIASRVKMYKVPELVFKYDETLLKGMKIDEILKKKS
jgi:ribosome-binding factor A